MFKPNITKLAAARDASALRAGLRHKDPKVRHDAARALGLIELPPDATERQGIVPQEAVADLLACWRDKPPQLGLDEFHKTLVEAIARIGGPSGVDALLGLRDDVVHKGVVPGIVSYSASEAFASSLFAYLEVGDLIGILLDVARPSGLVDTAYSALRLKALSSKTTPSDADRAREAMSEYTSRREQQSQEWIARNLDSIIGVAQASGLYPEQRRIWAIEELEKSRDPKAIGALVSVMLDEDISDRVRQAAKGALTRIGQPVVRPLIATLSEPHRLEGVQGAYSSLHEILQRDGSDLADEDLGSIASLGECAGTAYNRYLNPDDTYEVRKRSVSVDFSPIASAARVELARRASQTG